MIITKQKPIIEAQKEKESQHTSTGNNVTKEESKEKKRYQRIIIEPENIKKKKKQYTYLSIINLKINGLNSPKTE